MGRAMYRGRSLGGTAAVLGAATVHIPVKACGFQGSAPEGSLGSQYSLLVRVVESFTLSQRMHFSSFAWARPEPRDNFSFDPYLAVKLSRLEEQHRWVSSMLRHAGLLH